MPNSPPVYFSSLVIENVRCFGKRQKLDLTDSGRPAQWSLLVGENGAGKTTLLECLAWMRPVPEVTGSITSLNRQGGVDPLLRGRLKPDLTGQENEVLETLPRDGSREVKLDATLSFGGISFRPDGISESATRQAKNIRVGVQLSFDEQARLVDWKSLRRARIEKLGGAFHDPLIVSYGANRQLGDRNLLGIDELDPLDYERLSRNTELCDVDELLMSLDYAARIDASALEAFSLKRLKEVMLRILPGNQDVEGIQIYPPDVLETGRRSGVYVQTFTGLVPMSALSLGHRTTAGWAVDLAWRFLNRYRESPNPLAEPAVVLIDEIDLHLHPRWQLDIMKKLSRLFPATQFIATSHSPLIVQVAEAANLILLRKRDGYVEIVNAPDISRSLRVDQILTSLLFGVPSPRSEHIERLLAQRAELIDKAERSQEEEDLLRGIRQQIDEMPTAQDSNDQVAMDIIRRFANRLNNLEPSDP